MLYVAQEGMHASHSVIYVVCSMCVCIYAYLYVNACRWVDEYGWMDACTHCVSMHDNKYTPFL